MSHVSCKKAAFAPFLMIFIFGMQLSGSAQAVTNDAIKTQFIADWERAKAYTIEYLNAMPADKYSFKAVDSTRSFAQQMLHLAQANFGIASIGTGKSAPGFVPTLEKSPTAQTRDSVVSYVTQSYDFVIQGVKDLDASKLGEEVAAPRGNRKATRYVWLWKAFEHQTHHRGQTTIYIRLLGIRPPGERLF